MLNPRRLENAMNARGLTQIAMASILDVSKGTISKWINGNHSPRNANERLEDISKILNVPIEWLVSEDLGETSVSFFRTNTSSTKVGREVAEARLKWAAEILFSFSEWVDYPEVNLPKIYTYKEWVGLDDEDIVQIAKDCRKLWSLDNKPISDLMFTCEMAGICIVQEELGYPKMDGLSFWYNNYIINNDLSHWFLPTIWSSGQSDRPSKRTSPALFLGSRTQKNHGKSFKMK